MAVTNLRLVFRAFGDKRVNFSYPNANSSAPAAQVKNLMQIMVANGEIFAEPPLSIESATFVTTTSVPVDLS